MYWAFEAVSENIDESRGSLVTRVKQYASWISDIQLATITAISSSDLNARSFSSVSARLDHFAERLNQQDQVTSHNNVRIQSLDSSFNQFRLLSTCQFLSLEDQLKVLSKAPGDEKSLVHSPPPC